ncbi:helix-turn-helix transcriptional regulator [Rhizobium sp. XQZ8]|uniref:helix-turn-helix domain-containing protein n=1 Tax=Rhizobium populisoli TaxID=2859785 RepID=UPI001CA487B3|nr:helix-turn-helix transcriptional regulator [Rhizobium populisoli]MBW6420448.1 helix-turn-helix transcriptional regulator [Rhizobium populisoli]
MTGMTVDELAAVSGVSKSMIEKAEAGQAFADTEITDRLRNIFESKGIIFIGAGEGDIAAGPGVRMRQHSHDEGIHPRDLNAANDG